MLAVTTKRAVVGNPADPANLRRVREAYVAAHGRQPNAPLTRAECDDLATNRDRRPDQLIATDAQISNALLRMFGER